MSEFALLFSIINPEANFHKRLILKDLEQIAVKDLELLGGTIALVVLQSFSHMDMVGFSHQASAGNSKKQGANESH